MRTATVLYLAESGALPADLETGQLLSAAGLDPQWAEVASSAPGCYRLKAAPLRPVAQCAHRVEAARGSSDAAGNLALNPDRFRLWG